MQGRGRRNPRDWRSPLQDVNGGDSFDSRIDAPEEAFQPETPHFNEDTDAGSRAFALAVSALSGGVAGFFLAGEFETGTTVFVALAIGCVLGWIARGLAQ